MKAKKSYRIWFSQRNGSTLLCKGLEQTGIAGIPGEYFNIFDSNSLCEHYKVSTWKELRDKLWSLGTSENGVFGIKHSMHVSIHPKIFREIATLKGMFENEAIDEEDLLQDLFPNCKHIFLTRRNKVRQAVSWWKAIKDNQWHLKPHQSHENEADFYKENYDFDALSHLFKEAALRECAMQAYYTKHDIQPLTLVYEDFIKDFKNTIKQIIDYLDIEYDQLNIKEMYYQKTANRDSEKWVQRFREDLQKDWDRKIW